MKKKQKIEGRGIEENEKMDKTIEEKEKGKEKRIVRKENMDRINRQIMKIMGKIIKEKKQIYRQE